MRVVIPCLVAALALGAAIPAWPQRSYPDRPAKIVVGFPPGSAADVIARIVAPKLGEGLGQPAVVENRPGAGSNMAAEAVVRSPADGYTLLLGSSANTINASLFKMGFDFSTDLAPIALVAEAPGIELFNVAAGVRLTHVPYKGSAPAAVDLLAGRVALQFTPASTVVSQVRAGKLKALASIGRRRLLALPEVPTFAESGIDGFESSLWFGLNAPAATPREVIERLNQEVVRVLATAEVRTQFAAQSIDALPGTSEQFGALIRQDTEKWAKVVKSANVKID